MKPNKSDYPIRKAQSPRGRLFLCTLAFLSLFAQQTRGESLTGNTTVDGDLSVGNSTNKGNVLITGKTGGSAGNNLNVVGEGLVVFEAISGNNAKLIWNPTNGSVQSGYCISGGGTYSFASGNLSRAPGDAAVAMGTSAVAHGDNSLALGSGSETYADNSLAAFGGLTEGFGAVAFSGIATGDYSMVMGGVGTTAQATYSLVIGRYNIISGNATTWVDADPLFVIGNGASSGARKNALTVLKNGKLNMFSSNTTVPDIVLDPTTPQITVGGQALLVPDTSGNLGIGNSSPGARLEVTGPSSSPNNALFVTTGSWMPSSAGSAVRIGTGNTTGNTYGVIDMLQSGGTSANGTLTLNPQGGNVGIGTTSPGARLEVAGSTGGSAAPGLKVTGDGGVVFQGAYGTGQIPVTGNGTRFLWHPKKAALRAGYVSSTAWDEASIGNYSTAFGNDTTASGDSSVAMGYNNVASGANATALGGFSEATGHRSFAAGWEALASGGRSFAGGRMVTASGDESVALGYGGSASGISSLATGYFSIASGNYSIALGNTHVTASGLYSTAGGDHTSATSANSFVIGRYNVSSGNATTWVETDPLFVIGNGNGTQARNAFTVLKNGTVSLYGSSPSTAAIILNPTTSPAQITVGNSTVLLANSSGNVGIGTSSPLAKLDMGSGLSNNKMYLYNDGTYVDGMTQQSSEMRLFMDTASGTKMTFGKQTSGGTFTEYMRITNAGNVGIGTTSPTLKLDVAGSGTVLGRIASSDEVAGLVVASGISGGGSWEIGTGWTSMGPGSLYFYNGATSGTRMVLANSGNLGLGTIAPTARLSVSGTPTTDGAGRSLARFYDDSTAGAGTGASLGLGGKYNGSNYLVFGYVSGIKENSTSGNYASALTFATRANGATPAEQMRIASSGNVGIGTNAPSAKLEVNGDLKVSGTIHVPQSGDLSMGDFTD